MDCRSVDDELEYLRKQIRWGLLFVLTYVLYPPIFAFRAIAGDHMIDLPATTTTKNSNNRLPSISFRAVQVERLWPYGRMVNLL